MKTRILDATAAKRFDTAVVDASVLLEEGELVAFPTETVYGLGASARNPEAVGKIFAVKGRPADNPLIVHVADLEGMEECGVLDDRARVLVEEFCPGPLTLVVPAKESIPAIARAGLPTVALRIPAHPVALDLITLAGPLVAPSANLSGKPSPTTAQHVLDDLNGKIPAILDGGPCLIGIESTVVDLTSDQIVILRPGMITADEIEEVIGQSVVIGGEGSVPKAPGMKYRHYAPEVPIRLVIAEEVPELNPDVRRRILTLPFHFHRFEGADVMPLQERSLYALLREIDQAGIDEIVVYAKPGELDTALLNRLQKAAG